MLTDKLVPKDGMSMKAGFGLVLLTLFVVSIAGRFTELATLSPPRTGYLGYWYSRQQDEIMVKEIMQETVKYFSHILHFLSREDFKIIMPTCSQGNLQQLFPAYRLTQ